MSSWTAGVVFGVVLVLMVVAIALGFYSLWLGEKAGREPDPR